MAFVSLSLFQSTRPRRARRVISLIFLLINCFNPRAHAGRDASGKAEIMRVQPVSIHAPTQGATLANAKLLTAQKVSIHAPTQGATSYGYHKHALHHVSIHAPTQGATQPPFWELCPGCRFNPRAHAGRDLLIKCRCLCVHTVSIHAPTQGATLDDPRDFAPTWVSIHAPTQGATSIQPSDRAGLIVSIHAPTQGATFKLNRFKSF